jgi:hypothetical protein
LPFDNIDIDSCQRARLLSLIDEKGSNSKLQVKADKEEQQTRKTFQKSRHIGKPWDKF